MGSINEGMPSSLPPNDLSPESQAYHDRVPYLIGAISNLLSSGASRLYRGMFGIGLAEWRLMWVMNHESPLTVQRASQIMGIDKGATSRALAGLDRRGLVLITVDGEDSRRRLIELSEAGKTLRDQMMVVSRERERRLTAAFSEEELAAFRVLLKRLLTHARQVSAFDAEDLMGPRTSQNGEPIRSDMHTITRDKPAQVNRTTVHK
jgi:DNA-binding MarR family transcriptional regulator